MFGWRPALPRTDGRRWYEALRGGQYVLAASPATLPATAVAGFDHVEVVTMAHRSGTISLIRPNAYMTWAGNHAASDRTAEIRAALASRCESSV